VKFDRKKRHVNCEKEDGYDYEVEVEGNTPMQLDGIVEDFLVRTRRLLLIGEIDETASTHICNYLQLFSLRKEPVYMYINSPGGCISSGYAIIDQMLACSCPVWTIVRGQAHSMGAMIAAFGQKGCRFATPNSSMMLHSMIIQSTRDYIEKNISMINYLEDDFRRKVAELSRRLRIDPKQLATDMHNTKWMSPKQAIKIGLIDGVWTPKMELKVNKGYAK